MEVVAEMVNGSRPLMLIDAGAGTSLGNDEDTGVGAVVGAVEPHPATNAALHSASVARWRCSEDEPANRLFIW
jgi:hypothetical protein